MKRVIELLTFDFQRMYVTKIFHIAHDCRHLNWVIELALKCTFNCLSSVFWPYCTDNFVKFSRYLNFHQIISHIFEPRTISGEMQCFYKGPIQWLICSLTIKFTRNSPNISKWSPISFEILKGWNDSLTIAYDKMIYMLAALLWQKPMNLIANPIFIDTFVQFSIYWILSICHFFI